MSNKSVKKEKNNYVPIYNEFIKYKKLIDYETGEITYNELSLTSDELYIYYFLYSHRHYNTDTSIISVDLLSHLIQLFSKKDKPLRVDKNKIAIKNILESLKQKEIIDFTTNEYSYSTPLDISFNLFEGGYEKIYFDYFILAKTPKQLHILCIVAALKREISAEEFALRMGYSEKHIRGILKVMTDDKNTDRILNKYRGDYYVKGNGNFRQETNLYEIRDVSIINTEDREHNWYNWNEKLTYNDYVVYRTTNDNILRDKAKKRIDAITKSKNDFFNNWEERFNEQENKQNNLEHKPKIIFEPVDDIYFQTPPKRKSEVEDISEEELFGEENSTEFTDWGNPNQSIEKNPFDNVDDSHLVSDLPESFFWQGEEYDSQQLVRNISCMIKNDQEIDIMDYVFIIDNSENIDRDIYNRFMDKFITLEMKKQDELIEKYGEWKNSYKVISRVEVDAIPYWANPYENE